MTTTAEPEPQTAIDERQVENDALLEALNRRREAKAAAGEAASTAREAADIVKALIAEHVGELEDGEAVRVGPYRLTARDVEGGEVTFERQTRRQIDIRFEA